MDTIYACDVDGGFKLQKWLLRGWNCGGGNIGLGFCTSQGCDLNWSILTAWGGWTWTKQENMPVMWMEVSSYKNEYWEDEIAGVAILVWGSAHHRGVIWTGWSILTAWGGWTKQQKLSTEYSCTIVQSCTILCCGLLCCDMIGCTVLCCVILCCAELAVLYCAVLCNAVLHCDMLCCVMICWLCCCVVRSWLCCAMLCSAVLYYAVL
jgi:hypothetical protein